MNPLYDQYISGELNCDITTMDQLSKDDILTYPYKYKTLLLVYYGYIVEDFDYDIEEIDNFGRSGYLIATINGNLPMMKFLEERGFDINKVLNNGGNALHLASFYSHLEIVKYLIEEKNFDINSQTNDRQNAYVYAYGNANYEIMNYLEEQGINIYDVPIDLFLDSIEHHDLQMMRYLFDKGFTTHNLSFHSSQNAYLHAMAYTTAAEVGDTEKMEYLEEIGFDVHSKNINKENAYQIAIRK